MSRAEHLIFFSKFIERELGIVFSEFNDFQLEKRLEDVAKKCGKSSVIELFQMAKKDFSPTLKKMICDSATNNETYFFRDPRIFDVLKEDILPVLFEKSHTEKRQLKIWSMACSYGQEAYSVSFLCRELQSLKAGRWADPKIYATDIATHALAKAASGVYSQAEIERGLPPHYRQKYFDESKEGWMVSQDAKKLVKFQTLNLLTEEFSALEKFDLILCRNVLIYQSVENKAIILRKLKRCLNSDGFLLLGAGETLIGIPEQLDSYNIKGAIFFVSKRQASEDKKTA